jgi:glycerophosphoryl diester phosphodiesterase
MIRERNIISREEVPRGRRADPHHSTACRSEAYRLKIVGHQGSSEGVASGTMAAYRAAIAAGADMIEVDARLAKDGEFVAAHDATLSGRRIAQLTAADVIELSEGSTPALREVVELAADAGVEVMLDLKDVGCEPALVELACSLLPRDRFVISTLEDVSVGRISHEWPEIRVGLSLGRGDPAHRIRTRLSELFPIRRARACRARFVSVNEQLAGLGVIRQATRAGIPAFVWTLDEPAKLSRWLRDHRVEGVITNTPARAVRMRGSV